MPTPLPDVLAFHFRHKMIPYTSFVEHPVGSDELIGMWVGRQAMNHKVRR
jgi:hypothetical protein